MSIERRYTLSEIDEMRSLVWAEMPSAPLPTQPFYNLSAQVDSYRASQEAQAVQVEERLRTYMLAGLGPEDLRRTKGAEVRIVKAHREPREFWVNIYEEDGTVVDLFYSRAEAHKNCTTLMDMIHVREVID